MMEWFNRLPGVAELESAESFFAFFDLPYDASWLSKCHLPVLREFHRRLAAAVPLRNNLEDSTTADWQLARRLLAESYQQIQPGESQ
ncbi:nitrogenase-stabilizing/protective protein NifW [Brenneria uluponensis]|uniref:nitrogenase-stabilizing/protective protein NifW n=1 Tax=Brenneria uluponensis TaxID=3057057 RepID=UPI0028ECEB14|nr:nitrogenase-stabilizing/protective protein NifW [Brenneria ulupoensis]